MKRQIYRTRSYGLFCFLIAVPVPYLTADYSWRIGSTLFAGFGLGFIVAAQGFAAMAVRERQQ